jgi:alpha-tubulin suppressor-like RCC1 family protein
VVLHADGTLWASGLNLSGQLGDGSLVSRGTPVRIGTDNRWQTVSAGAEHNLALKADGTLWAWGSNASGQLGSLAQGGGPVGNQNAPLRIGTAGDWVAVAANTSSSYALKGDGTLWAWGLGSAGQLGNGLTTQQNQPVQVLNPSLSGARYVAVAAGADYVLALQADGSLWSFGSNASGQLGQGGPVADTSMPAQILIATALSDNDWSAIAAGGEHSLALKADGTLWSWGDNATGQLGLGSTVSRNAPVQVGIDRDWSAIAGGALHTLALKRSGSLWGWGDNTSGQIGNGTLGQANSPVQIGAPAGAGNLVQVSGGAFHSLALKANGDLYAWGDNLNGQFGTGGATGSLAPVLVGDDGVGWIAGDPGNQFTLARRSNGTLWSWGDNAAGQLGNGTLLTAPTPAPIDNLDNWAAHSAGFSYVVALRADGTLWSWGDNSFGQLGDNTNDPSPFPLQMLVTNPASALNDWAAVSAGDFHTLALKGDGTLWAWGDNSLGQLGDNTSTPAGKQPNQVITGNPGNFDSNWVAIAAGGSHSLGLQADGSLWAWGDNSAGQLGDPGIVGSVNFPTQVVNLVEGTAPSNSGWKAIAAGFTHSVALQADGTLWAWGSNFDGQLGNGDTATPNPGNQQAPVLVLNGGGAPYVAAQAGDAHSLARQADGSLWSWGRNDAGQLGNGATDINNPALPNPVPFREVGAASDWALSGVGGSHSMGLKADGTLWTWGSNFSGQLGDGSTNDRNTPAAFLEGFAAVAPTLDFGAVFVGAPAATRSLTIGNPGTGALFVTGVTLSGASSADFSVAPGTCGATLSFAIPAAGSCQLSLTFTAAAPVGARNAQLAIATSDPVQPLRQVALSALSAQHTITLISGANGSILGPVAVDENATPSYTITPATTFHIVDVTVDGISRGAVTSLTLPAVTADVAIAATFADTFAVNFVAGANGSLTGSTSQTIVFGGSTAAVTAVANTGYHFVNWTEGALVVGTAPALVLTNITAPRGVTANFAINTYSVNYAAGANGTLTGAASQTVDHGASAATVTAVPALGHHFVNWTEGGTEVATTLALTVNNVTGIHSFTANFAIDTFAVVGSGDAKGSLSPPGTTLVPFGSDLTVNFTPSAGYQVVDVVVDGVSRGPVPSFTLTGVTTGHTIKAVFIPDGDLDGDHAVTVADALRALQITVGLFTATPAEMLHGDVAPLDVAGIPVPNAAIGVADALLVLRKAVGLSSGF